VQQQNLVLILHAAGQRGFNLIQREVDRPWKMARAEFTRGARIDHQSSVLQVSLRLFGGDLASALQQKCKRKNGQNDANSCRVHGFKFTVFSLFSHWQVAQRNRALTPPWRIFSRAPSQNALLPVHWTRHELPLLQDH
jgi:hypothetical protein